MKKPKKNKKELPIPELWQPKIKSIVNAIVEKNTFSLEKDVLFSNEDIKTIYENIDDYGCQLYSLPDEAWESSVCIWCGSHWDVFIDLYEEEVTDLVLQLKVYEKDKDMYIFEIISAYVP